MSSSERPFSTNTLQRDRRAELTSNDGFSVVAPMRIIEPCSTYGRNASCCALLKRWISSTKRTVRIPSRLPDSALAIISLISLMPLVTAEKFTNSAFVRFAITFARVVFPTPGGPQRIIEGIWSRSIIWRRIFPSPTRCSCPMKPERSRGRIRAASGSGAASASSPAAPSMRDICRILRIIPKRRLLRREPNGL